MARRRGKKGDYLAVDDYYGKVVYGSQLRRDHWGNYTSKPLKRNLQEIASPLNDPRPVALQRGPDYEDTSGCIAALAPLYVGLTNVRTPNTSAAAQTLNLLPAIPDMEVGCSFRVYPSVSYVKSIQTFELTIGADETSGTVTISSVDTEKSVIFWGGLTTSDTTANFSRELSRVEITNATTITGYRSIVSASSTVTLRGTVVEFQGYAVTAVRHGTVEIAAGATSGTQTIASVDNNRAAVFYLGMTVSGNETSANRAFSRVALTNPTTITATRGTAGGSSVVTLGFTVVEFAIGVVETVEARAATFSNSATANTDTINQVGVNRTILLYNGVSSTATTERNYLYHLMLTDPTTVTLTRTSNGTTARTVNYTVLQFAGSIIGSIQRGATVIDSVTSADTTIKSVNTAKSVCNALHFSTDASFDDQQFATAALLNATTVRGEKNTAGILASTVGWEVIEFV